MKRALLRSLIACMMVVMSGCDSTQVALDLNQTQANEIVALLNANGISAVASRESGGRGRFSVAIRGDYYAEAIALLHAHNLPGEVRPSITDLLEPQGLIPSSRESEGMRLDYTLAAEITELLKALPEVASARVVVRMNFIPEGQKPALSAVVQERSRGTLSNQKVLEMVSRVLPGIEPANIALTIQPSPELPQLQGIQGVVNVGGEVQRVPLIPFMFFWRVPSSDYTGLALSLVGLVVIVGVSAGGLGYWFSTHRHHVAGPPPESDFPEVVSRAIRIERTKRDFMEEE